MLRAMLTLLIELTFSIKFRYVNFEIEYGCICLGLRTLLVYNSQKTSNEAHPGGLPQISLCPSTCTNSKPLSNHD